MKVFTQSVISWVSRRYPDHEIPKSISAVAAIFYNRNTKRRTPKGPRKNPGNLEMEGRNA
jgi:hypothetical protein